MRFSATTISERPIRKAFRTGSKFNLAREDLPSATGIDAMAGSRPDLHQFRKAASAVG
jgi:hypothetical protein